MKINILLLCFVFWASTNICLAESSAYDDDLSSNPYETAPVAPNPKVPEVSAPADDSHIDSALFAQKQQELMSDPAFMNQVVEIAQDPQIAQLLANPNLQQDIQSRDTKQIGNSAAIQELMKNPKMQALLEEAIKKDSSQARE